MAPGVIGHGLLFAAFTFLFVNRRKCLPWRLRRRIFYTAKLNFGWYVQHLFLGLRALTSVEVIGSVSYACEAEMNDMFAGGSQKSQANGASNKTGAKRKILKIAREVLSAACELLSLFPMKLPISIT